MKRANSCSRFPDGFACTCSPPCLATVPRHRASPHVTGILVLQHLMQTPLGTVLYLKSKVAGVSVSDQMDIRVPSYPKLDDQPAEVKQVLTHEYAPAAADDAELWRLANAQLDARIAEIGAATFARRLREFRQHLKTVADLCAVDGPIHQQKCLFEDQGCSYECVQGYARDKGLL